jgi:hypothetical protein
LIGLSRRPLAPDFYGASDTAGPASVRLNQAVLGDLIAVSVKVRKQNG